MTQRPLENIIITVLSSNSILIPSGSIVLGGSKGSRTIKITPAANQKGTADVTIRVKESEGLTADITFKVTVSALNTAPTISNIANSTIKEEADAKLLNFTIGDKESPAERLKVLATSSNQALIKPSSLILGGQGCCGL